MTQEIYVMAAISAPIVLPLIWMFWNAPEGWEDEQGWHAGTERDQ